MRERNAPFTRLLLIWVLLELVAAAQVQGPDGSTVLVSWMRTVTRPVELLADRIVELGHGAGEVFSSRQRLVSSNLQLKQENRQLRLALLLSRNNEEALLQAGENLRLMPRLGGIPARVLSRAPGMVRLQLSGAFRNSVHVDDPVLAAEGLLGRVLKVEGKQLWVEELGHPAAAIGVQSEDGRLQGLAHGLGGARLALRYIPQHAGVAIGQLFVSSGSEGIYPPGLPVCRVLSISESRSPFLKIQARSMAVGGDLRALRILSFSELPETDE